jgi:DNA processing protein
MPDDRLIYQIALGNMPGIGDINARKLIDHCGSIEAIFTESYRNLIKIPGIGSGLAKTLTGKKSLERAEQELRFIEKYKINTSFYLDQDYPLRLKECPDSPILIYYKGKTAGDAGKVLSVVGTRNNTRKGKEVCASIIKGLAASHPDLVIISGLAYGIDICAHKTALKYKLPTIGIMAHGFLSMYPSMHTSTAKEMLENGGLITDFLSDEPPDRNNFLKRNRIIAGMADATLVIESGLKGGSMVTADIAMSYNRDVLAVPGYPGATSSSGCNMLIKSQKASLVESELDIEYFLNWIPECSLKKKEHRNLPDLGPLEKKIMDCLNDKEKLTADQISQITNEPIQRLSASLLTLEFSGLIGTLPGNIYCLSEVSK